ncbi:exonuclease domain-containing protein, partial [Kocuria marina]|uniref:exonuclease domain-containing protein n=1 Tax=Kocuria marina TaxID=223184 RepID=UPI003F1E9FFA
MNSPSALEFTAIDFETANRDAASVCQVGVVRVEKGLVVERDSWLVIPPTGVEAFDPGNVRVHGIFPRDVRKKGITWRQSVDRLMAFGRGTALVAHNVSFDRGVFEAACLASGLDLPSLRWEDTLAISRKHLQLDNYKLPTIAAHVGLRKFRHHDAAADAEACARIAIHIASEIGAQDIDALWSRRKRASRTAAHYYYDRASKAKASELPQPAEDADPNHPFFGEKVVLTGDLDDMTRWDAFEAIAAAGGTPQKNVTLKTTLLIVAGYDHIPFNYDPSLGSGKEKKAAEYRDRGNNIAFIGASVFRNHLAWVPAGDTNQSTSGAPREEPSAQPVIGEPQAPIASPGEPEDLYLENLAEEVPVSENRVQDNPP